MVKWIEEEIEGLRNVTPYWWNESCVLHAPLPNGGAWHPGDFTPRTIEGWEQASHNAEFVGQWNADRVGKILRLLDSAYVSIKYLALTAKQDIEWEMACRIMGEIEEGLHDERH